MAYSKFKGVQNGGWQGGAPHPRPHHLTAGIDQPRLAKSSLCNKMNSITSLPFDRPRPIFIIVGCTFFANVFNQKRGNHWYLFNVRRSQSRFMFHAYSNTESIHEVLKCSPHTFARRALEPVKELCWIESRASIRALPPSCEPLGKIQHRVWTLQWTNPSPGWVVTTVSTRRLIEFTRWHHVTETWPPNTFQMHRMCPAIGRPRRLSLP